MRAPRSWGVITLLLALACGLCGCEPRGAPRPKAVVVQQASGMVGVAVALPG